MADDDDDALSRVGAVLGGKRVLGRMLKNNLELVASIREGLAYASYEAVARRSQLTTEEAVASLLIPRRTLARRKNAGTLDVASGERVVRLARLTARALDVFDDDEAAVARWLRAPIRALGGVTPLSLVDTDLGAQEALDVLGRIEQGVFS
jgi:putative toxin-antitoxin system antitoxin component (TIGR02293 family)